MVPGTCEVAVVDTTEVKVPFKVKRPLGGKNHPTVDFFFYTGEKWNPWRCGMCATKKHKERADEVSESEAIGYNEGVPGCCRKCGLDFFR